MLELIAAMVMQEVSEPITAVCVITGDREARIECPDDVPEAEALQELAEELIMQRGTAATHTRLIGTTIRFNFDSIEESWRYVAIESHRARAQDIAASEIRIRDNEAILSLPEIKYWRSVTPGDPNRRFNQPIVRVMPRYPIIGIQYEIEGTCDAILDITEEGFTENVVVECDLGDVGSKISDAVSYVDRSERIEWVYSAFEDATRTAVERWRYERIIEDGQPVRREGVETSLTYVFSED